MDKEPLLTVKQLSMQLKTATGTIQPIDRIDFTIHRGEIFALVGESGCGKTMTALTINRLLPLNAQIMQGSEIYLDNIPLHHISENEMQKVRANKIAMIFQDPSLALNPIMTIGEQLAESLQTVQGRSKQRVALEKDAILLLKKVRVPDPEQCMDNYPHQLSGGMKQRIVIAMALSKEPDLLIADEPTTALDLTTQAQVLSLIKELNQQMKMAILLITHDLGVVAQMADTVAVMYAGHIIEKAAKKAFLSAPKHPYSQKLFASIPENNLNKVLATIPGQVPLLDKTFHLCRFKERCAVVFKPCETINPRLTPLNEAHSVRCHWYDPQIMQSLPEKITIHHLLSAPNHAETRQLDHTDENDPHEPPVLQVNEIKVHFPIRRGLFKRTVGYVKAVDNLSFNLFEGKTLALVGESGCGKTTVGKAILKLIDPNSGSVEFNQENILKIAKRKLRKYRSDLQMIFQDPYSSMDPHMRVGQIIEEGMVALKVGSNKQERQDRLDTWLTRVGLPLTIQKRFAHQLSGGQRQRVAIARALSVGAQVIVCDEPTSALDLSVQAQILNLLISLQEEFDISYLFITHNMGVVNYLANEVAVMYLGRIVEYGSARQILDTPKHPYTQALLAAQPSISKMDEPLQAPKGEVPSPSNPPKGCHFAPRCPKVHARCLDQYPPSYDVHKTQHVRCYLYSPEEITVTTKS